MCYCPLNYDGSLILDVFSIKLSWNFVFLADIESVISWISSVTIFESVKEFHKLQFQSTTTFADTKFPLPQHSEH